MDAEIVAMCLRMFVSLFSFSFFIVIRSNTDSGYWVRRYNNPTGAGTTTSGGTESILMSVKTHRDWARSQKGITQPEMYASTPSRPKSLPSLDKNFLF